MNKGYGFIECSKYQSYHRSQFIKAFYYENQKWIGKLGDDYKNVEVARILQVDWLMEDKADRSGLQISSRYCEY